MAEKKAYYSDISGEYLGTDKSNFETYILPVDEYPELKNNSKNIVLMSKGESALYLTNKEAAKQNPKFNSVFNRAANFKRRLRRAEFKL